MKNKFNYIICILFIFIFNQIDLLANELSVSASNITVDKKTKTTLLKGNVEAKDILNNTVFAEKAKYSKELNTLETFGDTKIITSEGYILEGKNIFFDNNKKVISSNSKSLILDKDKNKIYLEMFNYFIPKKMFFSKGSVKIQDVNNNEYNFSEIYIDEAKNKIVGSDVKAFLKDDSFKANEKNNPRFFANSMTLEKGDSIFQKGVFTYCQNRKGDKCPPWVLRSNKIRHNASKKVIYYDNAVLKVYDFPIFYFPRFSHPDPSVKRKSGLLVPFISSNSTVGAGFAAPYFWAISEDKDLTITPKLYLRENPLLLAEYRQDFKNSFLIFDVGFTPGYKEASATKQKGSKSHIFSKFNIDFLNNENESSNLNINIQKVSNDTYLKVHNVNTSLASDGLDILENTINFNYQNEDLFLGANVSAFNDLSVVDNSKYEFLFPSINLDKNLLLDDRYGSFNLSSKLEVRNYDVDKQTEFLVNDINWKSIKWTNNLGIESQFEGLAKTVNYNASNTPEYKSNGSQEELAGVIGYRAKAVMNKNDTENNHLFTPRLLVRYAPGHMRNLRKSGSKLSYNNLFDLVKMDQIDVVENGLSAAIGFDYKKRELNSDNSIGKEKLNFKIGQMISEKENLDKPSLSSIDQRFSDIVGSTTYSINENLNLNFDFNIDQNYKDLNYNEISSDLSVGSAKFNIGYLEEKNHIGNQNYVKSNIDFEFNNNSELSFATKRNLVSNSAEFYNLSYSYKNDCLKAGILYRREFYTDRDIEANNSLMFKISIIPFGEISTPKFGK